MDDLKTHECELFEQHDADHAADEGDVEDPLGEDPKVQMPTAKPVHSLRRDQTLKTDSRRGCWGATGTALRRQAARIRQQGKVGAGRAGCRELEQCLLSSLS